MAVKKIAENPVEALESTVPDVTFTVEASDGTSLTFTQKPLTFFGKIEFFSVLGKAVEKIINDGGSIVDLVGEISSDTPLASNAEDAQVFVKAIARVVQYVPETLGELYCVILNVPKSKREEVTEFLTENLDDDRGIAISETFVDQNWEVMTGFFKERVLPLAQKVGGKFQTSEQ